MVPLSYLSTPAFNEDTLQPFLLAASGTQTALAGLGCASDQAGSPLPGRSIGSCGGDCVVAAFSPSPGADVVRQVVHGLGCRRGG